MVLDTWLPGGDELSDPHFLVWYTVMRGVLVLDNE
jgi:hypothetical protein